MFGTSLERKAVPLHDLRWQTASLDQHDVSLHWGRVRRRSLTATGGCGQDFPGERGSEPQYVVECTVSRTFSLNYRVLYACRDGVALCKLMNRLSPGCVKRINTTGSSFNHMDNIHKYVSSIFCRVRWGKSPQKMHFAEYLFACTNSLASAYTVLYLL